MIGETISHYRIVDKLGEGGMGVVYRAQDTRLDRPVALKFLAQHLVSQSDIQKRFLREAQTAALLSHPNICTVYEIGEADGRTFIAMEHLEGRELAAEIDGRAMDVEQVLDLGAQFADGLAAAHSKGIVHRDLKPANLFVTSTGRGVILDFGLAQLASENSKLTREGTTLGTCAYMSPEQASGEEIDARTDVWALGCVLYEMVAGQQPFRGHFQQAIVYSILNEEPEPLDSSAGSIVSVICKCLAKDVQARYRDGGELLLALRGQSKPPAPAQATAQRTSIVVLPFENRSRDQDDEYFSDGVSEDIITLLSKVDGLKVTPRASSFYFKGQRKSIAEIASALGVSHALTGSVRRSANRLRITAELIRTADESQMWSERYDRILEDVFDIQDEISAAISQALREMLGAGFEQVKPARRKPDIEAYRRYLMGREQIYHLIEPNLKQATKHFESALEIEPDYVEARLGIAIAYATMGTMGNAPLSVFDNAREAVLRVLDLDDSVAEAHQTLGVIRHFCDWDLSAAERSYRRAIEINPDDSDTYLWLSLTLGDQGRSAEGVAQARIALRLDPMNPNTHRWLTLLLNYSRDFEGALAAAERGLELNPQFFPIIWEQIVACCQLKRWDEAVKTAQSLMALAPEDPCTCGAAGFALAGAGLRDEATEIITRLERLREQRFIPTYPIIWTLIALGDLDEAFKWIEIGLEERDTIFILFEHHPWVGEEAFRADPRYRRMLDRIKPQTRA